MRQDSAAASPSLPLSLTPLLVLIALLGFNVYLYGADSLGGANQTALILGAALAAGLGMYRGLGWDAILEAILDNIRTATPAILILLMVGALTGTWVLGGVVPSMIYYGLSLFSPAYFVVSACLVMAVTAVVIGSSWSTSATLGVALMGIGTALGLNPGLVAGALISGAYFGDKMSPLSDTTNLASGVTRVELFTHIRYLSLTALPSLLLTLALFLIIGLFLSSSGDTDTTAAALQQALRERFHISPLLMLVPAIVLVLIIRKVPALPALFLGAAMGAAAALLLQFPLVAELSGETGSVYQTILQAVYGQFSVSTGETVLDDLLTSGGMAGMLNTIWLIIAAMTFGGTMEAGGFLKRITVALIARVRSDAGLISATAGTCLVTNISASDQYLSVVVPGRMFTQAYAERGLAPENLSRTLEDTGTVTSVLVPWNTCAAYHAGVLGVTTFAYAPWAFFCLISPLMTLFFAFAGIRIARQDPVDTAGTAGDAAAAGASSA